MKITIYELLGMVKDGKAPKKIKYDNGLYTFNEKKDNYYENETCSINWDYVSLHCLNETVEIIEEEPRDIEVCGCWITKSEYDKLAHDGEEKKIPEKIGLINYYEDPASSLIHHKVDEIIDYLKSKGDK